MALNNNTNNNNHNLLQNSTPSLAHPPSSSIQNSNVLSSSTSSLMSKQLNSTTLSKALTKPPPLSSLLNTAPPKQLNTNPNGSLSTANSSLSPSPSILHQQQPMIGSNLIAQSNKSLELLHLNNLSLNKQNNQINFSNSLPSNVTSTAQLFNSNDKQFYLGQPASAPIINPTQISSNNQLQSSNENNSTQSLFNNKSTNITSTTPRPSTATLFNQPLLNTNQLFAPNAKIQTQSNASKSETNLIPNQSTLNPQNIQNIAQPPLYNPNPVNGFVNPNINRQFAPPQTRPLLGPPPSGPVYQQGPPIRPVINQQYIPQSQPQPPVVRAPPPVNNQVVQPPPITGNFVPNFVPNSVPMQNVQQQGLVSGNNSRTQPRAIDLLRDKKLILPYGDEANDPPRPVFPHEFYTNVNCHQDTIRCTLSSIPESQTLLNKCRLPLGILIHPFKDLESLKVVQSSIIVRCRSCRSYINPFVHFLDNSKWRCNMCYSINDLPDEFLFDPVTRTYGDPSKRPEINSATIEFIAPPEYTLRPPPPAMYLYLLDVSHNAIDTGYLQNFCETLLENLDKIPGDSRAKIGFISYNSSIHFYNLSEALSQPKMMIYPDIEDVVLPMPDGLLVSLNDNKESIQLFLQSLPNMFNDTYETDSALGTALNAAYQLLKPTGGRITIMQSCLPNIGVGGLKQRDEGIDKESSNLAPQTDFYKKLALDCAGSQVAVDLFMFNSLNADLATLSCVSKYSGGEIKYYPGFHPDSHPEQVVRFCADFKRYLTRKIGFEAVMRIRCTRGLAIHTFHGNFFVRSTDLLALPNVNPDAGFGMQVNIEDSLTDIPTVCFQAAVLYTSSKSERRIRIHTYCLPVSKSVNEIVNGADQEAIIGLISKMAVDRTAMSSLKEARDAMINVAIDYLQAYSHQVTAQKNSSLVSPYSLRLIPLYVLALMKNVAFKFGTTKMDDRVYAMNLCKTMPLKYLMLSIYPSFYAVHNIDDRNTITDSYDTEICIPPKLHLSSENIDRHGIYIMDCGEAVYMWVGRSVSDLYLQQVFDCKSFGELPDHLNDLPELENELSEKIRNFLAYLYDSRPFGITFLCFKEGSHHSSLFFQHMHDDKTENSISYYEFLKHLNDQINN